MGPGRPLRAGRQVTDWPPTGRPKLDAFLEKLGRMTLEQVDAAITEHDALEHELEAPGWNLKSALLLDRKIRLQARR